MSRDGKQSRFPSLDPSVVIDEFTVFDNPKEGLIFVRFGRSDKCPRNAAGRLIGPQGETYGIFYESCQRVQIRKIDRDIRRLRITFKRP